METGIFPIPRSLHQAVLDWIVVNVFHVLDEVSSVSNLALPETPLPYRSLPLPPPWGGDDPMTGLAAGTGEGALDQPPARREIAIPFRQGPNPWGKICDFSPWSGKRTKALILKGWRAITYRNAFRKWETFSDSHRNLLRRCVTSVKKYVPPSARALRYFIASFWLRQVALIREHPGQKVGFRSGPQATGRRLRAAGPPLPDLRTACAGVLWRAVG